MSKRLQAMGIPKYKDGFNVKNPQKRLIHTVHLEEIQNCFCQFYERPFHEDVPPEFIQDVFKVMGDNSQHIFQVLTKRAERLYELDHHLRWTCNIWMGVSVEDRKVEHRIGHLQRTSA